MNFIEKLSGYFLKFPGIGPRQAKRFAFFLANSEKTYLEELGRLILETKNEIRQCTSCFRFYATKQSASPDKCDVCVNLNRDTSLLMVVEKDVDFENIERTGVYNGKYFVLGGTLPLSEPTPSKNNLPVSRKIKLRELFEKVKKDKPKEIILAISATVEGENTARYVAKILEPLIIPLKAKISHLGRGLSTGAELEYVDGETMSNAMRNRK